MSMERVAYFDCFSGISGDMTLGAFVDLGVPADWLGETLKSGLNIAFDLSVEAVHRSGIAARQVTVTAADQTARHYTDIRKMIESSGLSEGVKARSLEMFERLASAEAGIHGCEKEDVHFHEVGAVDAIVDIVGCALCVEYLAIDRVFASKIPFGRGSVTCAHGILPVPVPATVEILKDVPAYGTDIPYELVTPTGATIIKTLAQSFGAMPDMEIKAAGYGSGSRHFEGVPNLLRVVLGQTAAGAERMVMVETCIDDMNPEIYGFISERLMADGAVDVYMVPVFMKKQRPGTLFQVLCPLSCKEAVIERMLTETTTLGLRYYDVNRRILEREAMVVETRFGPIAAKRVKRPDGAVCIVPEYEACKAAAAEHSIPIRDVYDLVCRQTE
ncbi:MAG: nickel pincer cofactor biosynthesis protein LarC [Desulfobacterales bacterium]